MIGSWKLQKVKDIANQQPPPWLGKRRGAEGDSPLPSHTSPGHEDLFSCCQRKNFQGAPCTFFTIHITAALVLFMTDGMTVSCCLMLPLAPSHPSLRPCCSLLVQDAESSGWALSWLIMFNSLILYKEACFLLITDDRQCIKGQSPALPLQ